MKAILALESWIDTHGAILVMEESQTGPTLSVTDPSFSNLAPSITNMAPHTKTTLTSGFVLAPHKGAAFDQHIGPYELRFGSPSRNDSRIGQIDPGMKSTLLSKRPFCQIDS